MVVVDGIFRALPAAGVTVLPFDFRDGTEGYERHVLAAVQDEARHLESGRPLWLVG